MDGFGCELCLDWVAGLRRVAQLLEVLGEGCPVEDLSDVGDTELVGEPVDDVVADLLQ